MTRSKHGLIDPETTEKEDAIMWFGFSGPASSGSGRGSSYPRPNSGFEAAGVEFLNGGQPGVRMRKAKA
jgi:hypothetical protein